MKKKGIIVDLLSDGDLEDMEKDRRERRHCFSGLGAMLRFCEVDKHGRGESVERLSRESRICRARRIRHTERWLIWRGETVVEAA